LEATYAWIVFIVTGTGGFVFGSVARLIELFEYGPVIPGPLRKKPKTSLY
jgi:hypothetical protein